MYNLNIPRNYLPSLDSLNSLSKYLHGAIIIFGYTRAALKTLEISGVSQKILEASCNYFKVDCNQVSSFALKSYKAILNPTLVRVATPAYIIFDSSLKYADKGVVPIAPLAWFAILTTASSFTMSLEEKERDFKAQFDALNDNSSINEIVAALNTATTRYSASIRTLTEGTAVVSYIAFNTYVNYKTGSKDQAERKIKLEKAKANKDTLAASKNAAEAALTDAEAKVTALTTATEAAQLEVATALAGVEKARALTTAKEIEPTTAKVADLSRISNEQRLAINDMPALALLEAAAAAGYPPDSTPPSNAIALHYTASGRNTRGGSVVGREFTPCIKLDPVLEEVSSAAGVAAGVAASDEVIAALRITAPADSPKLLILEVATGGSGGGAFGATVASSHAGMYVTPKIVRNLAREFGSMGDLSTSDDNAATVLANALKMENVALRELDRTSLALNEARTQENLALRSFGSAATGLNSEYASALQKTQLAREADSILNEAKLAKQQAETNFIDAERLLGEAILLITTLSTAINAYHPYAILITGFALMELHTTRAFTAYSQAIEGEKVVEPKFQMLMKNQPAGVLNEYFDCIKDISVGNSDLIPAILNWQCTPIAKTDITGYTSPFNQISWNFTATGINDVEMRLSGEYYSELPLITIEA